MMGWGEYNEYVSSDEGKKSVVQWVGLGDPACPRRNPRADCMARVGSPPGACPPRSAR